MTQELLELPAMSHLAVQNLLEDLQAIQIEVPGRAPCSPERLVLEDNLSCTVVTRTALAARVNPFLAFASHGSLEIDSSTAINGWG